mmetsp:Transcript_4391/g.9497  ORF Transcript_4391/g.9497 Transcript_4391/m.9497 type:complete len:440 (+) Transcript_4391:170-1489(+)
MMVAKGAGTRKNFSHNERILTQCYALREFINLRRVSSKGSTDANKKHIALFTNNSRRQRWVADLLLMLEQSPVDKVHALLAIASHADAAAVACRAIDPDLIHRAVFACEQGLSNDKKDKGLCFFEIINQFPEAMNMFTTFHCRLGVLPGRDIRPSTNILLEKRQHAEAGLQMAKKALAIGGEKECEKERIKACLLKEASKIFDMGGKDCLFQKSCTDEHIALIADQEQLRRSYGSAEVAPPSSSLASTITSILSYGAVDPHSARRLHVDADRIAKKYNFSEKRLWHVKVRAFSESGQWTVLRNLVDSRAKPPIGIKPFALAAIKGRQHTAEISHYIDRMTDESDAEDRYDLFCKANMWKNALEESVRLGDERKIAHVKSRCNSPDIQRCCEEWESFFHKSGSDIDGCNLPFSSTQTCDVIESLVEQVTAMYKIRKSRFT